jgi:hypothetical protein
MLAFFAGNEVINEQSVKHVPTYVRVCHPFYILRLSFL